MCPMQSWVEPVLGHRDNSSIRGFLPVRTSLVMVLSDGALVPAGRNRLALPLLSAEQSAGGEGFVAIADNAGRVAFWLREGNSAVNTLLLMLLVCESAFVPRLQTDVLGDRPDCGRGSREDKRRQVSP